MSQAKVIVIALVTLIVGFTGGFVLRPILAPSAPSETASAPPAAPVLREARGTQYFMAHVEEARQIVAGCRNGSVRGGECANAEEAIIKVDAAERRRKFLGN